MDLYIELLKKNESDILLKLESAYTKLAQQDMLISTRSIEKADKTNRAIKTPLIPQNSNITTPRFLSRLKTLLASKFSQTNFTTRTVSRKKVASKSINITNQLQVEFTESELLNKNISVLKTKLLKKDNSIKYLKNEIQSATLKLNNT